MSEQGLNTAFTFGENNYDNHIFCAPCQTYYQNHNDRLRELTEKGLEDSRSVTAFLSDKKN